MKNGEIAVAKDLTISPQLTRAQFLASELGGSARQVINNYANTAFTFTAQISKGYYVYSCFTFLTIAYVK